MMKFNYIPVEEWPPMAWLAKAPRGSDVCTIMHGKRVEVRPDWFCEAVWPGDFEEGAFDQTDLVAGSGGRIRAEKIIFVAPGNTVDRLLWSLIDNTLWVSNSLACMLAITGARIDITYPRYYEDFSSIIYGLLEYKRTIATNLGDVGIHVFGQLAWDGNNLSVDFHRSQRRDFSDFCHYERFLHSNLEAVSKNMSSTARVTKFKLLTTISAGYDSPACASLAKQVGCTEALSIDRDRFGEAEHGDAVAQALGLTVTVIERMAWRQLHRPELAFMAAGGEAESIPLAAAANHLDGKVLLTGYHGDKVWAKDTKDTTENIVRGDHSGLALSEFRLRAGFIHLPITFWGVRQIADIKKISNSEEMHCWDVDGDYSRPIPRRIVESAGVPRNMFGISKRASAVGLTEFLSEDSLASYLEWLAKQRGAWILRGRLPPILSAGFERFSERVCEAAGDLLRAMPLLWRLAPDNALEKPSKLRRHVFPWALNEIAVNYRMAWERKLRDG